MQAKKTPVAITEFGPSSPVSKILPSNLLEHMNKCSVYLFKKPLFEQYIVWRYTIGSASINSMLIFGKLPDNAVYWTYLFILYWKNTSGGQYIAEVPRRFAFLIQYFDKPDRFNKLTEQAKQSLASQTITLYIKTLQSILLKCPTITKPFEVYKVSSKYPGLPESGPNFKQAAVVQIPFNSTTINPHFNFAPFLAADATCCFFEITLIAGSKGCLYVPYELHAYPFENEVILPFGCVFDIYRNFLGTMDYIDAADANIDKLQVGNTIEMGPVYNINSNQPCKNAFGGCNIRRKPFQVFETIYKSP